MECGEFIEWKIGCLSSLTPWKPLITGTSILAFGFAFVIMLRCTSVTIFPSSSDFEETNTLHISRSQESLFSMLSLLFTTTWILLITFGCFAESAYEKLRVNCRIILTKLQQFSIYYIILSFLYNNIIIIYIIMSSISCFAFWADIAVFLKNQ